MTAEVAQAEDHQPSAISYLPSAIGHQPSAISNQLSAISHLAVGTDLVEVRRIVALVERYGERFTRRVFTPGELADCGGRAESLAARWAAKEAAAKALGCGIGAVAWHDIEVVRTELGAAGSAAARRRVGPGG